MSVRRGGTARDYREWRRCTYGVSCTGTGGAVNHVKYVIKPA